MQPYFAVMLAVNDAEARGDAAGALAIMDANLIGPDGDCFWKPWRMKRLMLITLLGTAMPGWMTSRWILEQAQFAMHDGVRTIHQRAESVAVELRGGWSAVEGVDPLDARGRVSDRDWVYRQLALYDYGGLRHFLRHQATPDLVAGADRINEWAVAPMGGYGLVDSDPVTTTWLDLHTGERYGGPNIGSAAMLDVGEHVIGRLVPTDEGSIFETQPLRVPESLARAVSERPAEWVELLRDVLVGRGNDIVTHGYHYQCFDSDVPPIVWQMAIVGASGLGPPDPAESAFDATLARVLLDAARVALETMTGPRPPEAVDIWPCLGAAITTPYVTTAVARVLGRDDVPVLAELAGMLADPASQVCLRLADGLLDAA